MPKVVLIPEEKGKEELVRIIKSKLSYYGMYQKDLAAELNVVEKTITNRFDRPELFTLQELMRLCKRLKVEVVITEKGVECR